MIHLVSNINDKPMPKSNEKREIGSRVDDLYLDDQRVSQFRIQNF